MRSRQLSSVKIRNTLSATKFYLSPCPGLASLDIFISYSKELESTQFHLILPFME